MMREIATTSDRGRTGVLDVEWDGSQGSLFFLFGHPNHAVFTSVDGRNLVGNEALDALVHELPAAFRVASWRRAMVTEDTLRLTAGELLALFAGDGAAAAAEHSPAPSPTPGASALAGFAWTVRDSIPFWTPAAEDARRAPAEEPDSGFPLLPLGRALWSDEMANITGLGAAVPHLPDCLLMFSGAGRDAAALVAGGVLTDAVSVAGGRRLIGGEAAAAMINAPAGVLSAHRIDDARLVTTLPLLWRGGRISHALSSGLPSRVLSEEARASGRTGALVVEGESTGVVLFHNGEVVAVYTTEQRRPSTDLSLLDSLLHERDVRLTVIGEVPPAPDPAPFLRDAEGVAAVEPSSPPGETSQVHEPDGHRGVEALANEEAEGATAATAGAMDEPADEAGLGAADTAAAESPLMEQVLPDFVAPRLDIDVDALRTELSAIAIQWLGSDDAVEATAAVAATRPGVADFVSTIAAIGVMDIPGHERSVIRAMAREMHYRASEVLCGI